MTTDQVVTIGLVGHSVNSGNLGIGALTLSQISIVEKVAATLNARPHFKIFHWADPYPAYVNGDNITKFPMRTRDLARPIGGFYSNVKDCDLVLDIGAGDSFADIYGSVRLGKSLTFKALSLVTGAPLVLSPQTFGPFKSRWGQIAARTAIRKSAAIVTRDELSTTHLREIGYNGEVTEATDVAFRLPYDAQPISANDKVRFGLNVSGLLFNGGYSRDNMFSLKSDYARLVRAILKDFTQRDDCELHLVAHVLGDQMPVEDDYAVCQRLSEEFPSTVLAPRFIGPSEAKSYIQGMDFFAGARMHACIAAFSSGVPTVPMAYSRKFAGLFGALGYETGVDCRSDDETHIRNTLIACFENRLRLREDVDAAIAEAERRLSRYEAVLSDVLASVLSKLK